MSEASTEASTSTKTSATAAARAAIAKKATTKKAPAKKATTKKATTKKAPTSNGVSAKKALSAKTADRAQKAIAKMTKNAQKPMGVRNEPFPVVPSGSLALDNLIGGNPAPDKSGPICPGYPRKHITEVYGPEASGKTTLALEAIAECQKQGGVAMFLDFEHALHHGYAQSLGVDFNPEKLMLYQPDNMEQGLDMALIGIKAGVDIVVVDSVAAMVTADEMKKNISDTAKIGARAAKLADALPKIVKILKDAPDHNPDGTALMMINQTRAQIGGMSKGDGTSGGKALKFFAYLRLQANKIQSEYVEKVDPVTKKKVRSPFGNKTIVKVVKTKVDAKQGHTANIFIRYGQGIDNYATVIESAAVYGLVQKSGAYYEYEGTRVQGREKFRAFLLKNPKLFDALEKDLLATIRAHSSGESSDDDGLDDEDDLDELLSVTSGDGDDEFEEDLGEAMIDDADDADEQDED
jgi:recombination protein RecA